MMSVSPRLIVEATWTVSRVLLSMSILNNYTGHCTLVSYANRASPRLVLDDLSTVRFDQLLKLRLGSLLRLLRSGHYIYDNLTHDE